MRFPLALAISLTGCLGGLTIDLDAGAVDGATTGRDAAPMDSGPIERDAGPPPVDAGPCETGLAANFSLSPIAALPPAAVHAAATRTGGLAIAWASGDGVHLTRIDGAGRTLGADTIVPGNAAWGVAVSNDDSIGVIVDRGSDEMHLVAVGGDGSTLFDTLVIGGVPHDVTENEWFGTNIRAGRLAWTGTTWAVYVTVQRLWSDGIAHYGDTLRFYDSSGSTAGGGWGWGCSHSMEVGIVQNGAGTGPVCVSDCFPGKGVFFNHTTALFDDPSGNCGGRIDTRLGGIAAQSDGFLIAFATPYMRGSMDVALIHVANDQTPGPVQWLTTDATADANVHIAPYGGGALVGWNAGGTERLVAVDRGGSPVLGPEDVPGAGTADASDFVTLEGGDVAWVTRMGAGLAMARVRACF